MRVGSLVKYLGAWTTSAIVLRINSEGGTIKVLLPDGQQKWWVTSGVEVVS